MNCFPSWARVLEDKKDPGNRVGKTYKGICLLQRKPKKSESPERSTQSLFFLCAEYLGGNRHSLGRSAVQLNFGFHG